MHVYLWLMAAPLSFTFLPAECSFSSPFFPLFSTLIHSTLSVLCLPPLSAHLWSDKSQIIWLTMQNARCRNPPIPSSAQLANYSEELAHASLLRWGGEERDGDWWGQRGGKRGREEGERTERKGKTKMEGISWKRWNQFPRQARAALVHCLQRNGQVQREDFKTDRWPTQESSSLLQHDAGESTCASKRP